MYRVAHTPVLLHGSVYVVGGREGESPYSNRLDIFDLTTNQWNIPPFIMPQDSVAMTVLD